MSIEKIGRDIEEEIASSDPESLRPDRDPSKPFEDDEIKDLRSPKERADSIRAAQEKKKEDEKKTEAAAEEPAVVTGEKPANEDKEKESIWAEDRKKLADGFNDLRRRMQGSGSGADAGPDKELRKSQEELIKKIIEQAAREDSEIATDILKEGLIVATDKDVHKYGAGMDSVVNKILGRSDRQSYLTTFLSGPAKAEDAIASMQRDLKSKIENLLKSTEALKRREDEQAKIKAAAEKAEQEKADKKAEASKAMFPFFKEMKEKWFGEKGPEDESDDEQERKAA